MTSDLVLERVSMLVSPVGPVLEWVDHQDDSDNVKNLIVSVLSKLYF